MTKKTTPSEPQDQSEKEALLTSLQKHGQVVESENPDVALGPGQTHVLVKKPGESDGRLIEKRKSFFKR